MRARSSDNTLFDLKVYDDETGAMLGYVTAVGDSGLEMLLDQAIDLERERFFTIDNILEMEPGHTALFAAICEECDTEGMQNKRFHARLTFTQLSDQAKDICEVLH